MIGSIVRCIWQTASARTELAHSLTHQPGHLKSITTGMITWPSSTLRLTATSFIILYSLATKRTYTQLCFPCTPLPHTSLSSYYEPHCTIWGPTHSNEDSHH